MPVCSRCYEKCKTWVITMKSELQEVQRKFISEMVHSKSAVYRLFIGKDDMPARYNNVLSRICFASHQIFAGKGSARYLY